MGINNSDHVSDCELSVDVLKIIVRVWGLCEPHKFACMQKMLKKKVAGKTSKGSFFRSVKIINKSILKKLIVVS